MKEAADRACAIAQLLAFLVVIAPALALDPAAETRIRESILTLWRPPVAQLVQETSDKACASAHLTAFLLIVALSLALDAAGIVGTHSSGSRTRASCGGTISREPPHTAEYADLVRSITRLPPSSFCVGLDYGTLRGGEG